MSPAKARARPPISQIELPPFRVEKARPDCPFIAAGHVWGAPPVIHCFEARKLPAIQRYRIEERHRLIADKARLSERLRKTADMLGNFCCLEFGAPSHLVTIRYTFIRDSSVAALFSMPLNFSVPGKSSDSVAANCCKFAATPLLREYLRQHKIQPIANPATTARSSATSEYWLALLFTRFSWEFAGELTGGWPTTSHARR